MDCVKLGVLYSWLRKMIIFNFFGKVIIVVRINVVNFSDVVLWKIKRVRFVRNR